MDESFRIMVNKKHLSKSSKLINSNLFCKSKNKKKGVVSIIAVTLLLLASIVVFFQLQSWFELHISDFNSKITYDDFKNNFEILEVDGTYITLRNQLKDNLDIQDIQINGRSCFKDRTINEGRVVLDIAGCALKLEYMKLYEVLVITKYGLKSEMEIIKDPPQSYFVVRYQTSNCDFSSGYIRLLGLSSWKNAHAEIYNSSLYTYNVCVRHLNYTISVTPTGNDINLLYLPSKTNSALFTDNSTAIGDVDEWYTVSLSTSPGESFDYIVNSSNIQDVNYGCIAEIEEDNVYGSHIGTCNNKDNQLDKLWLKIE